MYDIANATKKKVGGKQGRAVAILERNKEKIETGFRRLEERSG